MATGICMRCVLLIECQHISVVRILSYSTSANCLQLNSLVIDQLFMKQAQERERSLERASEKFVLTISARLFLLFDAKTETEKGTYYNMIVHTAKKSWCNVNLPVRIHRMIQGKKNMLKNAATASGNAMLTVHEVEIIIHLLPNQEIYYLLFVHRVLAEKYTLSQNIGIATAVDIAIPYFQCR